MAHNKNVLYISYDGMTDSLGQSQVIPYLIGLTKMGYNFTILSCEKRANYYKDHKNINNILQAAKINWQPVFYTKRPPVLSTLYDYYKLKRYSRQLNEKYKFNLVHCRSYIPSLIGLWMTEKYNIPFIFDMRGFWADERVDGGLWNLNNPIFKLIYNFFKSKEIQFLNRSAAIISLTNRGKNEMLTWGNLNFKPDKISVIPCCVDTDLFDPDHILLTGQTNVLQTLKIDNNDLVIGYLGSIGTWYMLNEMLQFFCELKKEVTNAKFLFVTHNNADQIKQRAIAYNINTNDIIITPADRKDVPLMVSLFNYGLFFIKPSYSKISSSPTKQAELMAMGIPIICNSGVGDTDKIIEENNAGIIIKNYQFKPAIKAIAGGIKHDGKYIRERAISNFSLNSGIEKYNKVYKEVEFLLK